jgi:hypothetical protein
MMAKVSNYCGYIAASKMLTEEKDNDNRSFIASWVEVYEVVPLMKYINQKYSKR